MLKLLVFRSLRVTSTAYLSRGGKGRGPAAVRGQPGLQAGAGEAPLGGAARAGAAAASLGCRGALGGGSGAPPPRGAGRSREGVPRALARPQRALGVTGVQGLAGPGEPGGARRCGRERRSLWPRNRAGGSARPG